MQEKCLFLSFYFSILIGIPVSRTNAFHNNLWQLEQTLSLNNRAPLIRLHNDDDIASRNGFLQRRKQSSTKLPFRQSSPMGEQINAVDMKVDLQQQRRRSKKRNIKKRNRKGRSRNGRIVQSALPNTNIIPASDAVPNRWKQFRRRRFPRFLLRGNLQQNDVPGSDESFLILDKNVSIAGLENIELESGIDTESKPQMLSTEPIPNESQEETDDSTALAQNQKNLDSKMRDPEGKQDNYIDAELKISKAEKDNQIKHDKKKKKENNLGKGKRIQFSATETSTRKILLDEITSDLFIKYMNQPVEDYSLFSVSEQPQNQPLSSRRFNVRRLTRGESNSFEYTNEKDKNFMGNFFRLSAPLMPLVGLNLTPIIDLEVVPPSSSKDVEQNTDNNMNLWGNRISSSLNGKLKGNKDTIKMRSMRVDLLSTEAEILDAMKGNNKDEGVRNGIKIQSKPATSVSSNKNVQEFGNEAICFFERMDKNVQPHLDFDSFIKWIIVESKRNHDGNSEHYKQIEVSIKSSIVMSLTIPPTVPFAVPSTLVIKQVGSLIAKRVLGLTLPRFLNQLGKKKGVFLLIQY